VVFRDERSLIRSSAVPQQLIGGHVSRDWRSRIKIINKKEKEREKKK